MLTIALDEQGHFEDVYDENKRKKAEPVFIGGLIFDDKGDGMEAGRERKRIDLYLRAVCMAQEGEYPQDLHINNERQNSGKVGEVKGKINETFAEFVSLGTCREIENEYAQRLNRLPRRKGVYYIFANMVCDDGSQRRRTAESAFVREDYAGNLYIHMAEEVVERLIFHNPYIENIDHVCPELASRRAVLEGADCDRKAREYRRLGYIEDEEHSTPEKRVFCLTNKEVYRTAIQREMLDTEQKYIRIDDVGVKSIYYGDSENSERMAFLFLADAVCSNLGYRISAKVSGEIIQELKNRADSYTGHGKNLIFAHDPVDTAFRKAWTKLEEKDYYNALRIAFETTHENRSRSPYTDYYRDVWFQVLKERLKTEKSLSDYKISVDRLFDYTRQSNIRQDMLEYIFSSLESMKEQMQFPDDGDKEVLYKLYNSGVSAYCHLGRSDQAIQYFEKCREYARYVGVETYIRTRNKLSECLCDKFRYKEGDDLAKENVDLYDMMLPLRHLISGDESEKILNHGIVLSQWGQTLAFQRKPEAETQFQRALQQMEPDSANYFITLSYLLHFYLDMEMREAYEAAAVRYFGGKTKLKEQLACLLSEGNKGSAGKITLKYALYVFVRAVYLFYMDKTDGSFCSRLLHIEETIKEKGKNAAEQIGGHPWEMIYKYLAFIAWDKGEKDKAQEYLGKMKTAVRTPGMIIDMLVWSGQIEFALHTGEEELAEEYFRQVPESLEENSSVWELIHSGEAFDTVYKKLREEYFTFMFC